MCFVFHSGSIITGVGEDVKGLWGLEQYVSCMFQFCLNHDFQDFRIFRIGVWCIVFRFIGKRDIVVLVVNGTNWKVCATKKNAVFQNIGKRRGRVIRDSDRKYSGLETLPQDYYATIE